MQQYIAKNLYEQRNITNKKIIKIRNIAIKAILPARISPVDSGILIEEWI